MQTKKCTKCNVSMPATKEYFTKGAGKYGFNSWCKECRKTEYQNNKQKIAERSKKYYKDNKPEIAARQKKRHAAKNYPTINDENILKSCQICKEQKPSTTEHFCKCKSQKDGLNKICKLCRSEQKRNLNFKPLNDPNVLKPCSKCKIEKPATTEYFSLNKTMKLGLNSGCKECDNNNEDRKLKSKKYYKNNSKEIIERTKQYRIENPDESRQRSKKYYQKNKEVISKKSKTYYENNREQHLIKNKIRYENNKEKIIKGQKEYYERVKHTPEFQRKRKEYSKRKYENLTPEQREKLNKRTREWKKQRLDNDPALRLFTNQRNRIKDVISKQNAKKVDDSIMLLGYNPQHNDVSEFINFVREHIESTFEEGMSWENYGSVDSSNTHPDCWHIDHIIPCAAYDYANEEDQFRCFNYRNLRACWAKENLEKNAAVITDLIKEYDIEYLLPVSYGN